MPRSHVPLASSCAAAMLAASSLGCSCARDDVPPSAEPSAAASPGDPVAPAPWAIRFSRSCSVWEYSDLLATDAHVFACAHAVFDAASGELVDVRRGTLRALATAGPRSLWALPRGEGDVLLVRDADLSADAIDLGTEALRSVSGGLRASPDARRVLVLVPEVGPFIVDLVSRRAEPSPGAEACAGLHVIALGWTREGATQCMVEQGEGVAIVTLREGGATTRALSRRYGHARWDPRGGTLVAWTREALVFLDESGERLAEAPLDANESNMQGALDVSPDGQVLVATGERTELWSREGDRVMVEPVLDRFATHGVFAGEMIVLELPSRDVVWMHRGAPGELPPLPMPVAPEGYTVLTAAVEGDDPTFESEDEIINRDRGDVVAFSGDHGHVVVSRGDAAELARFAGDDAAWAAMVAARYVERGSERWAYFFRDAEGRRVVLGHSYIGGCERTHIDVRVLEHAGGVLERWTLYTGAREDVDAVLGARPASATEVESARGDTYEGDPSIGEL